MKRSVTFLVLLAAMALLMTSYSSGPFYGGASNRTGSAGSSAGCDGPICHAPNGGSASLSIALLQNGLPVNSYVPGGQYRIKLTLPVTVAFRRYFGFQASIVKAGDGVTQAGFLSPGGRTDVSVYQDVLVQVVEQNRYIAGTPLGSGSYLDTVSFAWQAPAAGYGSVRVYAVINAVDSSGGPGGDQPRAGFQDFRESTTGVSTGQRGREELSLLPNVVGSGGAALELRGLRSDRPLNLAIVDMSGRLVWRKDGLSSPDGTLRFGVESLSPGRYAVVVAQQAWLQHLPLQVK